MFRGLGARPDDPNVKWLDQIGNPPIGRISRTILGLNYCPTMLFPNSVYSVGSDTSLIWVGNQVADYPWDSFLVSVGGEVPEANQAAYKVP